MDWTFLLSHHGIGSQIETGLSDLSSIKDKAGQTIQFFPQWQTNSTIIAKPKLLQETLMFYKMNIYWYCIVASLWQIRYKTDHFYVWFSKYLSIRVTFFMFLILLLQCFLSIEKINFLDTTVISIMSLVSLFWHWCLKQKR